MFNELNVLRTPQILNVNCEALNNDYKIPNIIHFTFCNKNLPHEILNVIEHNKKVCNKCKFIFYDDNSCDEFIKNNFNREIYNTYKKINPSYGAMRADFFRYCVLYIIGGIYIDIKSQIEVPIFKIINKKDLCILDIPRSNLEPWRKKSPTYEQWLLIFAPRHPYLLSMINLMFKYINQQYIPTQINGINLSKKGTILNITGPDAFTKAVNQFISNNNGKILHRNIDYNTFARLHSQINYKKMYAINKKKHYSEVNEPIFI
jgi:mannosyltransferase OCH1-like enzyme